MDYGIPGFPVHHQLLELVQSHVHQVGDAIPHFIFCCSLFLPPSISPSIRVFSRSFPVSQFFASGGQSIGVSASVSVLPRNIQDCFPFGLTDWKSVTVSIVSASICHEVMGPDAMILVFLMLSFKPAFALSCFTFIKRLFSSSSLSAIRVVSSAYLRLLIIFLAILIPACASSSPAFHMMYSVYKLSKQGDNIQP